MEFEVLKELKLPDDIFDARFHPSKDNLIVAATIAGNLHLIENGEIKYTMRKHHKGTPIRRIRFDKNNNLISIAKTIKIHDLENDKSVISLKRDDDDKSTFNAVLPLGPGLICAGDDEGKVFVWDTRESDKQPLFSSSDCEQYISGIDGKYEGRRMFVCTSGEGTLTAYDLRANKKIEPQSELFEAGFQCVKMVDLNKKLVIGGEDGAVYVFNHNEWAHTSGKFAVSDDTQNRGKCSIEGIDLIPDSSVFLTACSDGKLRALTLWPHRILSERTVCKRRSLECLQVNPLEGKSEILVGGENYLNVLTYSKISDKESDNEGSKDSTSSDDSNDDDDTDSSATSDEKPKRDSTKSKLGDTEDVNDSKKLKSNTDDYLNVFN